MNITLIKFFENPVPDFGVIISSILLGSLGNSEHSSSYTSTIANYAFMELALCTEVT